MQILDSILYELIWSAIAFTYANLLFDQISPQTVLDREGG